MEKPFILIPAKGTSRRIPNKNKQLINGIPLYGYAIIRSLGSKLGDVYVSSEDPEVIEDLKNTNANLIVRDEKLSKDNVRAVDVCLDAIERTKEEKYTTLIMTLPTSPLSTKDDLIEAYNMFLDGGRSPILSVNRVEGNPRLCLVKPWQSNSLLKDQVDIWGHTWDLNSFLKYDSNHYFRSNGAVFICDIDEFKEKKEFYIEGMKGFEMPDERGLDVNTPYDLKIARLLMGEK